jgi:hypothetical protein
MHERKKENHERACVSRVYVLRQKRRDNRDISLYHFYFKNIEIHLKIVIYFIILSSPDLQSNTCLSVLYSSVSLVTILLRDERD